MPEMHLRHPVIIYSAYRLFTKKQRNNTKV